MKNLDKYKSLLSGEVEGLLLTSRYSRHYAAEFDIAEGVALVSRAGCRYFTDSRYIESAEKNLVGFEVLAVDREHTYTARVNEACADFGVKTLGFEESYLTVEEFRTYEEKLTATLKPCQKAINAFRAQKEPGELRLMEKAQEITDKAFSEVLTRIRVGMTEKELCAELIYCLYKNGADGLSFDPIVVSGPNTSMPHGVPGERVIQEGDFITMDFGVLYEGYCSDMTRTVVIGKASEKQKEVYHVVLEGDSLFFDVALYVLVMAAFFLLPCFLRTPVWSRTRLLWAALVLALGAATFVFTWCPPDGLLFRDLSLPAIYSLPC